MTKVFWGILCRLLLYRLHPRLLYPFLLTSTETIQACVDVLSHGEALTLPSPLTRHWEKEVGEPQWHSISSYILSLEGENTRGGTLIREQRDVGGLGWHTLGCQIDWKRGDVGRSHKGSWGKRKDGEGMDRE